MPTRQGWMTGIGAVAAIVIGRVFGILELFVIGASLAIAVVLSVVLVRVFRPRLAVHRWVHPAMLTVGDTGRVDLAIGNTSRFMSPRAALTEPVGDHNSAHLTIASLPGHAEVHAGYRVPAPQRGVMTIGPTTIERRDLLGLAVTTTVTAPPTEVIVAPQTFELALPSLGHGVLGRHLLALSQRTGLGEFHSLRDYVAGDEPRSIHWRASARSLDLKVRQHEAQGVRRCIVVLDRDAAAYTSGETGRQAFERAISIAASIALSADRAGLTTRFVSGGGIDLRGPEVAVHTLHRLATIELGGHIDEVERDPGEGLGLAFVVTGTPTATVWRRPDRNVDPTLTRIGVFTEPGDETLGRLMVDASSTARFREHWVRLAGRRGLTQELLGSGTTS